MNNSKYLYHISLISTTIILFLILASSTVSVASAQSSSPAITQTQITTSGSAENPAIYGNRIVWQDDRNWNWDIYMYDISTKKETQITTNESNQFYPVIYGDRIVLVDDSRSVSERDLSDIHMYDLSTKKETKVSPHYEEWGREVVPAIYGDKIVCQYIIDDYAGISMYDLSTKEENFIPATYSPAIYGNRMVYYAYRNEKSDIYMYDLSTKKETRISTSGSATIPAIYGDRIVWQDDRSGNSDIYMYDISTKKETQITSSPDNQRSPAIYDNRVVWQDDGGEDDSWENHGIYMYDISTNQKIKISTSGGKINPKIYGNRVVYSDDLDGNSDIYMSTISSGETKPKLPVASFSASPTSGYAPLTVKFTDKSANSPISWKWSFGDGTYSTVKNPVHKYSKAGKYAVSLTVKNAAGSNTVTKSSLINVAAPLKPPVAAFLASPRSGKTPLKVQFTDKSINSPTSWKWSFGDKTYSTQKNPAHIYNKAGKYTVYLTVKNAKGSNTKAVSGYVIVK